MEWESRVKHVSEVKSESIGTYLLVEIIDSPRKAVERP